LKPARFKKNIIVKSDGKIIEIDNKKINSLARIAGSPLDKAAGLYLYKHVGERINTGEKIVTIYSESRSRLRESVRFFHSQKPIKFKH